MQEFIYVLKLTRPSLHSEGGTHAEHKAISGHVEYLRSLAEQGNLILAGRTQVDDERTMGLVIFRAEDMESAQVTMQADPVVKAGVMQAELFPYSVAIWGNGQWVDQTGK